MKSSKLVTYLTQIAKYEVRLEIAREILAHNMNFSPAWLLALLQDKSQTSTNVENNSLRISQFRVLLQIIGLVCTKDELILIFEYFDRDNTGVIKSQDFIEFMLPTIKDGLRKAVLKRIASDVEITSELRHCLKRFFIEILAAKSSLKLYQGQFGPFMDKYVAQNQVTKEKTQIFLNKFGKHPTGNELSLIINFVNKRKGKQVSFNQICNIMQQSSKQIQYLAHNPGVLNQKNENQILNLKVKQLEGMKGVQKILRKGLAENSYNEILYPEPANKEKFIQQRLNERKKQQQLINNDPLNENDNMRRLKIQRTNSILQNQQKIGNPQTNNELKKASKIADKLLLNLDGSQVVRQKKQSKQSTPFHRIETGQFSTPTIYYSSRRKSMQQSDIVQMQGTNAQLEDEISQIKRENLSRTRNLKYELGHPINC